MTNLELLLRHELLHALGWTLLHFVWQGALAALAYAALDASLPRLGPHVRYAAACACLAAMLALPGVTFLRLVVSAPPRAEVGGAAHDVVAPGLVRPHASEAADARRQQLVPARGPDLDAARSAPLRAWAGGRLTWALPWLVLAWLVGVALFTLRAAGGWLVARRLSRRAISPAPAAWQLRFVRLACRLRVPRAVGLCQSALVEVPTVIGWLRPVVLVPAGAFTGLTPAQLEALLAHELAHVRRYDYLVNLLQTCAETLLFYHPAVWWLSRRIRVEREHACDDAAVEATGDVFLYAHSLAALEALRQTDTRMAASLTLAADGGSLMERIQRLCKTRPARPQHGSAFAAFVATLFACAGVIVGAQTLASKHEDAKAASPPRATLAQAARRRVAVTFVSLPAQHTFYTPRAEKDTRRLLDGLKANDVPAVGFVNEDQLYAEDGRPDEERINLLRMWLDAGVELGTQTRAHTSLFKAPVEEFQADVIRGEEITGRLLSERGRRPRFFSYPFLNTGPNVETKRAVERWLAGRGYQLHKVTIDNMDWLYGRVYAQARRAEDEETMRRVAEEYLPYMERTFEYYEGLARETLGYEPPQVLLLTANALNAHKLDELLAMMKRRGYAFVTLEEALKDPAYGRDDDVTGQWGISWLQRWAMAEGRRNFAGEPYVSPFMRRFDISNGGTDYSKQIRSKN